MSIGGRIPNRLDQDLDQLASIHNLVVIMTHYGLKATQIGQIKADCHLDCRGVPDAVGSGRNGDDPEVQNWVASQIDLLAYIRIVVDHLLAVESRRRGEVDPYLRPVKVATFCAFGIHRSRAMKHLIADYLKTRGITVQVESGEFQGGPHGSSESQNRRHQTQTKFHRDPDEWPLNQPRPPGMDLASPFNRPHLKLVRKATPHGSTPVQHHTDSGFGPANWEDSIH